MRKYYQIAIDGPVGAGKSTVAKMVADRLGWLYVYTGAMYRATALLAKEKGIDWNSGKKIAELLTDTDIEMKAPSGKEKDDRVVSLFLNGEDVSREIMSEEISQASSVVSTHLEVREELVRKQQEIAKSQNVVMEGRDITFRVLPDADLKVFLTAGEEVRAKRRYKQLIERGQTVQLEEILSELKKRDRRDSRRKIDPLQIVEDAWVIDTTKLSKEKVIEMIVKKVGDLGLKED